MSNNNPFDIKKTDLGDNRAGIDRLGVDELFSHAQSSTAPICLVCGNLAQYKLIPKHKRLANAEIESKGYSCSYCISQRFISPEDYKLQEL